MTAQAFEFDGARGYRHTGRLELPDGQPQGWAILAHCFTCGKDSLAATRLARALAARDIGVLRFDFAGMGKSGGSFANTNFAADVEDLVAAGNTMDGDGKPPSILVGHSVGGAAVLMAAGEMPGVRAVATLGAPLFNADHLLTRRVAADYAVATISARASRYLVSEPRMTTALHRAKAFVYLNLSLHP